MYSPASRGLGMGMLCPAPSPAAPGFFTNNLLVFAGAGIDKKMKKGGEKER